MTVEGSGQRSENCLSKQKMESGQDDLTLVISDQQVLLSAKLSLSSNVFPTKGL